MAKPRIVRRADTEVWRDIFDYEGVYQVSSFGRVRRALRKGGYRILATNPDDNGRPRANLSIGYVRKNRLVSGLVAEVFIGPRPEGFLVCHDDGDNTNNRATNLRYDTQQGNMQDMVAHGTACFGGKSSMSKLTEQQVIAIRQRGSDTLSVVASAFGVSVALISMIRRRIIWKHLP